MATVGAASWHGCEAAAALNQRLSMLIARFIVAAWRVARGREEKCVWSVLDRFSKLLVLDQQQHCFALSNLFVNDRHCTDSHVNRYTWPLTQELLRIRRDPMNFNRHNRYAFLP